MKSPTSIIIDTDIGNDIDDVIALTLLHGLHKMRVINIESILTSNGNEKSAFFLQILNFYYDNHIPIGRVITGKTGKKQKYLHLIPLIRELFPDIDKKLDTHIKVEDADVCFTSTLQKCMDQSVILLMIGFSTNIANLLKSEQGRLLAESKIRKIICMAGHFPYGPKEYNIYSDAASFQYLLSNWHKEIDFIGFELGEELVFTSSDIAYLEELNRHYPLTLAYRSYKKYQYNQPGWDPLAVIYSCFPHELCFIKSEVGSVQLNEDLSTTFLTNKNGTHRYIKTSNINKGAIKKMVMKLLTST